MRLYSCFDKTLWRTLFTVNFINTIFLPIVDMSEECQTDVVPHPTDGWRVKATGKPIKCKAKLDKILEQLGPYGQKYIERRWDYVEE